MRPRTPADLIGWLTVRAAGPEQLMGWDLTNDAVRRRPRAVNGACLTSSYDVRFVARPAVVTLHLGWEVGCGGHVHRRVGYRHRTMDDGVHLH